ncbi:MAG: CotH kinase family protein [Bacteroidales bacterium]|nr:CotH kinase family protein [Candidatus Physcocola equi]
MKKTAIKAMVGAIAKKSILLSSLLCAAQANATISLTEIMPSNIATVYSEQYDFQGYVELYNDGAPVDLKGWIVNNESKGEINWSLQLQKTHIVPTGYSLLFFGEKETGTEDAEYEEIPYSVGCVPGKLSTDASRLVITDRAGTTLTFPYPKQVPHLSYCPDGFMEPSPAAENNPAYPLEKRVAKPVFSATQPGFYNEKSVEIALTCATEGATVYYTTNGSIPTKDNGTVYTSPIKVDSTVPFRARAYKNGALYSEVLTGTFLLPHPFYAECGPQNTIPIVSIVTDDEFLHDGLIGIYTVGYNGLPGGCTKRIYANYYQDWTRAANFEYVVDGKVVDNQEVEIAVYGGCSRQYVPKSLKIKANKRTGKNEFYYDNFFTDRSYTKYKSLALRNGGNGYGYLFPRWRDGAMQYMGKNMNLDIQAYQPVAYFLNGSFYGMMGLRERTDDDYVYHNYGYDDEEIDHLREGDYGYEVSKGDDVAYNAMIEYVENHYNDADFLEQLDKMMDVDEYMDYEILEQWLGNTDWPNNNTKLWRKRKIGRFRWIVYDTDFGMSQHTSVTKDMLKLTTTATTRVPEFDVTLMKHCMMNTDFKYRFLDKYFEHMKTTLSVERVHAVIDSIAEIVEVDMCATMQASEDDMGWVGNDAKYNEGINSMKTFANKRSLNVFKQLRTYYDLGLDTSTVVVHVVCDGVQPNFSFFINDVEYRAPYRKHWTFTNERVKVRTQVPAGYLIDYWEVNGQRVQAGDPRLVNETMCIDTTRSEQLSFKIVFKEDPNFALPKLYINEVCASNGFLYDDFGDKPDWIEIYNGEDHDVDLAGMTIINKTSGISSVFPFGFAETVIPAGGRKVIWADKNQEDGPLHLAFKLSASAQQELSLQMDFAGNMEELDNVVYDLHDRDCSYGRVLDGSDEFTIFTCGNNDKAVPMPTPRYPNGSWTCFPEGTATVDANALVKAYPNPTKDAWTVTAGGDYELTNMMGQKLMLGNLQAGEQFGSSLPAGVYLLKINGVVVKLVKE